MLSLEDLKPFLLNSNLTDSNIVELLKKINQGFTSKRGEIKDYVMDADMVSAYSLFYLITNIPKFEFLMSMLPKQVVDTIRDNPFCDIGTGPGTYLVARELFFQSRDGGKLNQESFGVDSSSLMLDQAKSIFENLFNEKISPEFTSKVPSDFKGTLFFGHSINEMGHERALSLIVKSQSETIVMIEPGTPESFKEMILLRDKLQSKGFETLYPCGDSKKKCPMIVENKGDWCHQVWRGVHDPSVERLSQLIKRDRKTMPMLAHVLVKRPVEGSRKARFVQFIAQTKHSFEWKVCIDNQLFHFEIPKKTMNKSEVNDFKSIGVGGEFEFEVIKELSETKKRVKIKKTA